MAIDTRSEFDNEGPGADARVRWHVLHCRSRQEKRVHEALVAQGVESVLPLVPKDRRYAHRLRRVETPLFSGYVFMHGARQDAFPLVAGKRVVRIIGVPDEGEFLSQLEQIRRAIELGAYLDPCPAIKEGWRVRIHSGPLMGLIGVVDRKPKPDRLVLQVDVLGQGASVDISAFEVEPVEAPTHGLKGGR